jgi:hypothetical protein
MEARSSFVNTTIIHRHSTQVVVQSHSISNTMTGSGEYYRSNMTMTMMINQDGLSGLEKMKESAPN